MRSAWWFPVRNFDHIHRYLFIARRILTNKITPRPSNALADIFTELINCYWCFSVIDVRIWNFVGWRRGWISHLRIDLQLCGNIWEIAADRVYIRNVIKSFFMSAYRSPVTKVLDFAEALFARRISFQSQESFFLSKSKSSAIEKKRRVFLLFSNLTSI